MSVKRYIFDAVLGEYTDEAGDECTALSVVSASAHDAEIAARDAAVAALQQRISNALTDLKAIRGELYGIGKESSHEFHRIGVESALGITKRAIASLSPPPSTEGESA